MATYVVFFFSDFTYQKKFFLVIAYNMTLFLYRIRSFGFVIIRNLPIYHATVLCDLSKKKTVLCEICKEL